MKKHIIFNLKIIILALVTVGAASAYAWTGPTQAPTGGNTPPPINTGTTNQIKNGGLTVNALTVTGNTTSLNGLVNTGNIVNSGNASFGNGVTVKDPGAPAGSTGTTIFYGNIDTDRPDGLYLQYSHYNVPTIINYNTKVYTTGISTNGVWYASDIRLKKDITPLEDSLDKILSLRGVNYFWKDKISGTGKQTGFIAQEVEKVFPEVVSENDKGTKNVNYSALIAPVVESIKTIYPKVINNTSEIAKLKAENKSLEERIAKLESLVK